MFLFIDTINAPWNVILFNSSKEEVNRITWESIQNEASTLIPNIDKLLKNNNLKYEELENIVVVNGPGSFTWVRTTTIVVNGIAYVKHIPLTEVNFFELFEKSYPSSYPIVKKSSRRDHFVKYSEDSEIEIISNDDLEKYIEEKKIEKVYWELNFETKIVIIWEIDYNKVMNKVNFENKKMVTPLYIKKPNIS